MITFKRRLLAGAVLTAATLTGASAVAWAAGNNGNDKVLHGTQYREYFKDEGNDGGSRKDYMFTTVTVPAPPPGRCIVVSTGGDNPSVAVHCNDTTTTSVPR